MKQPMKISQLIDKEGLGNLIPKRPTRPSTYNYLKQNNPEHHIVKDYESALCAYQEYQKKANEAEGIIEKKEVIKPIGTMDVKELKKYFCQVFYKVNKEKFNPNANDGEANQFLCTLLYYFAKSDNFYKSNLLYKEDKITNDLNKGLLVIGGYGCGKTSFFKAFHYLFKVCIEQDLSIKNLNGDLIKLARYNQFFKYFTANQVVEEYEVCAEPADKDFFWQQQNNGRVYYDDILTEREANNYGKAEIFKDILEKRYDLGSTTLISCNYHKRSIKDKNGRVDVLENVNSTLWQFGKRYGPRIYDRLFSMFNIIELKGKSLRR